MIDQYTEQQSSTTQQTLSPQQIKSQLKQSFKILSQKSPSTVQLQRCHDNISRMMKEQLFFDTSISLILQFQQSTEYANIPKLVITTLSTFLKHQQSTSRLVKKIDKHTLNRKLLDTFMESSIEEEYRLLIIKSYTQYIYAPAMQTIRAQTVELLTKTFTLLSLHLKNELKQNNSISQEETQNIMSYIFIVRAVTKGPIQHVLLKSIVTTYLPSIQILLIHFLSALRSSIRQKNEPLFVLRSGICCKLLEFFKELVLGTSKQYSYLIKQSIMMDQTIKEIIYSTLSLTILQDQPNHQITQLIIDSNGNKFVQRLNQMKAYSIGVINHFAKICLEAKTNLKQLQKDQYKMPLQLCKYFILTVSPILIKEFESLNYPSKDLPHPAMYKAIINTLSNVVRINLFFEEAYQLRTVLFFNLCLPLLQRKDEQYSNGEQFKGKREDILNTHSMDIPQNAACKLIESYIDRIDGSIAVFSSAIVNMIEFHLSANPNFYNQLPAQLTNSYFFRQIDYMTQIQCCLSVFALFSYMSIGREELVIMLQKLLVKNQSFFFKMQSNGMFKAAVLLTYSYYVDNFYANLVANKSSSKHLHLEILQYCCNNMELFTTTPSQPPSKEYLLLQISALQSLDCITNSITQKLFLPALFYNQDSLMPEANQQYFHALFNFLIKQLYTKLNVGIMDTLAEFFLQAIKGQCNYGHAIKRFHFEYKQVPMVIKLDVCNMMCGQIYNVFNATNIPNNELMRSKIINLLQTMLTCAQFPDQFMNHQFFSLRASIKDIWDIAQPIDIYLRRTILLQQQGLTLNAQILQQIVGVVIQLLKATLQDYKPHNILGIVVNLMVIDPSLLDHLAIYMSNCLIKLLTLEEESQNYDQDLQALIEKIAYLNLIAIYIGFNTSNQAIWCALTQSIQSFLQSRSTKGIIATKSIPYVGKLLSISLVCLCNMRKIQNIQSEQSIHLWNNVLRSSDVYTTATQKQVVSSILISLLGTQPKIEQSNEQCKKCFNMVSHLLYKAYSKAIPTIKQNYDNEDQSSSGFDDSEDHQDFDAQGMSLNYQQYKIAHNEYTKRQTKEKYILLFKNLCHQLKQGSPQFLLNVVEALPLPIRNFVKSQVFYFQNLGESQSQAIRKVVKVKKVIQ